MPRRADPAKRRELLDRVRAYVVAHGLADLSLRPMAKALGTSDRMLLYYFGSKERLVAEALAQDADRPILRFRKVVDAVGTPRDATGMRRLAEALWREIRAPERRALLPLYFQSMASSMLRPERHGPYLGGVITEWADLLAPVFEGLGMSGERARIEARMLVDGAFGMLVASLADGDEEGADLAYRTLLDRLEAGWCAGDRTPGPAAAP
ncbi:TetR/AcrR family transcriptional regulator [Actinacidiphila glaucinigra]|uniref:Transcriptional regulator, TetR family n=1 Tax=Actinacidiphila glaucinigra TaxID=235986 RepID=A0A239MYW7_9ACTN|nr:TetR/AcrR family transcriptional regulator [Actinacidiphila glaucinigra]SNT47138.1 transcriptional regulator, TetR family [Actinacidiphila glaucinigra]